MHRTAERDERCRENGRTGRSGRARRVLAGAVAVPVMCLAAACSSDSGSGDPAAKDSAPASSGAASPSVEKVEPAAFSKLPQACTVLPKKSLEDLVPKGVKSGKAINEGKPDASGDCRWISLDNNGVDGSQYRWLSVSLLLQESDQDRGAGDARAAEIYDRKVGEAQAVAGAKNVKAETLSGTGDTATAVRYDLKKKEGTFRQQTVVVRVENVVFQLDYNGAGLAGDKTPSASDLMKEAKAAAKQVVASVRKTNGQESADSAPGSSASKSAAPSKSAKDSKDSEGSKSSKDSSSEAEKSDKSEKSGSGSALDSDRGEPTPGTGAKN